MRIFAFLLLCALQSTEVRATDDPSELVCEVPPVAATLRGTPQSVARQTANSLEGRALVLSAVRAYALDLCDYNRGGGQCRGHAEGLATALLHRLGVELRPSMLSPRLGTVKYGQLPIDGALRGRSISSLGNAGTGLQVGQLIHTKCHCNAGPMGEGFSGYSVRTGPPGHPPHPSASPAPGAPAPVADPDPTGDAHHWVMYVGDFGGQPRFVDNSGFSIYRGCKSCSTQASTPDCRVIQRCLERCRAGKDPAATDWCDPNRPETCLMTLDEYQQNMRGWGFRGGQPSTPRTGRSQYCEADPAGPGGIAMPCVYGVRDPLAAAVE